MNNGTLELIQEDKIFYAELSFRFGSLFHSAFLLPKIKCEIYLNRGPPFNSRQTEMINSLRK